MKTAIGSFQRMSKSIQWRVAKDSIRVLYTFPTAMARTKNSKVPLVSVQQLCLSLGSGMNSPARWQ